LGEEQGRALSKRIDEEEIAPEVVLVSSLSRAIKTGLLGFASQIKPSGESSLPFECVDDIRETLGTHPCDKRRSKTELSKDFAHVDFSGLATETDERWSPERETDEAIAVRAHGVLDLLAARKESKIAIVSHNDFLTAFLFHSGLTFASDEDERALRVLFGNADLHTMVLEWSNDEEGEDADAAKREP